MSDFNFSNWQKVPDKPLGWHMIRTVPEGVSTEDVMSESFATYLAMVAKVGINSSAPIFLAFGPDREGERIVAICGDDRNSPPNLGDDARARVIVAEEIGASLYRSHLFAQMPWTLMLSEVRCGEMNQGDDTPLDIFDGAAAIAIGPDGHQGLFTLVKFECDADGKVINVKPMGENITDTEAQIQPANGEYEMMQAIHKGYRNARSTAN